MSSFETRAIHVAQDPDQQNGAVIPPIYLTSTHKQNAVGELANGYEYNRGGNPTRDKFQNALANLESAKFGYSFASGLAAEDAIIRSVLKPGDHAILASDLYGGTYRLFKRIHEPIGIRFDVVDLNNFEELERSIKTNHTKLVWIETPSNPYLTIFNIKEISNIAHKYGAITVIDNTFATPYLQRPIELGADIVIHSTTKYIGGHSDLLGGAVLLNDEEIAEKIHFIQFAAGAVSSPFDSWLIHRSLKTLAIRVKAHCQNAEQIAHYLDSHPKVKQVFYPGLPSHPNHDLAKKQMSGFGGIVSVLFENEIQALTFCNNTKLFTLAESLGGVESLVNHPAKMTHASVRNTPLEVPGSLVRLSVGIEGVDDLIADLNQALNIVS